MTDARSYRQYVAATIAAGSGFSTGIMLGWSNPVEIEIMDGIYGFPVSNDEFSWVGAALPLGAAIASIPSGFMMDGIGRKLTIVLLLVPFIIGWLLILFATNVVMLYLGRAVQGVACGAVCVAVPMYTAEIAEKEVRGTLGSFFQLLLTLGILVVYTVGSVTTPLILTIICAIITVIWSLLMILMPESPVFLIEKGKDDKAEKSIIWLRGKNYDSKAELTDLREDINQSKEEQLSFFEGFRTRACLRALYISLGLMMFEQLTGVYAVIFYSTAIFKLAGSSMDPEIITIWIGILQVIATLIAVLFVDRFGRRVLLLISAAMMAGATLVLGMYFFYNDKDPKSVINFGWLPITASLIFIVTWSIGFGTVTWIMNGELFPANVKGPAGALAVTSNWLMAFVVCKTYVDLEEAIGAGMTFCSFSAVTALGFLFVIFFVPETKGKSLAEIQNMLSGRT